MMAKSIKQFLFGTFLFMSAMVFHVNYMESPKVTKVHEYKIHEQMMEHVKLESAGLEQEKMSEVK